MRSHYIKPSRLGSESPGHTVGPPVVKAGSCRTNLFKAVIAILICMVVVECPAITADDLAKIISQDLAVSLSKSDAATLQNRSYNIATTAMQGATDVDSLRANLVLAFQSNMSASDWDKYGATLKNAATRIALEAYPDEMQMMTEALAMNAGGAGKDTNDIAAHFNFWTGAKFNNPYKFGTNHSITSAGNSSDGYIEISYSSRFVERSGIYQDPGWFGSSSDLESNQARFVAPWGHRPDFETRLGYLFRGSSSPTNFSSTIVGSSDFYGDTSVGFPFMRYLTENWKEQLTLEANGGFATDKNFLAVHPNMFFGFGYQASFTAPGTTNSDDRVYWYGRAGVARIDVPNVIHGTNTVDRIGEPQFRGKWVPSLGVEITYPLTSTLSLQASANAYFTSQSPGSWNASLGVTLDIGKFFGSVLGTK